LTLEFIFLFFFFFFCIKLIIGFFLLSCPNNNNFDRKESGIVKIIKTQIDNSLCKVDNKLSYSYSLFFFKQIDLRISLMQNDFFSFLRNKKGTPKSLDFFFSLITKP